MDKGKGGISNSWLVIFQRLRSFSPVSRLQCVLGSSPPLLPPPPSFPPGVGRAFDWSDHGLNCTLLVALVVPGLLSAAVCTQLGVRPRKPERRGSSRPRGCEGITSRVCERGRDTCLLHQPLLSEAFKTTWH